MFYVQLLALIRPLAPGCRQTVSGKSWVVVLQGLGGKHCWRMLIFCPVIKQPSRCLARELQCNLDQISLNFILTRGLQSGTHLNKCIVQ